MTGLSLPDFGVQDAVNDAINDGAQRLQETGDYIRDKSTAITDQLPSFNILDIKAEAVDDLIDDDAITGLGVGDSYTIEADVSGGAAVVGGTRGELSITHNEDGTYTVRATGEATAGVGLDKEAEASGRAGVTLELKYDSAEEAIEGSEELLGLDATNITDIVNEETFKDNLTAIEFDQGGDLSIGLGGGFDFGDDLVNQFDVGAGIGTENNIRLEFDQGKPTDIVLTQTLQGNAFGELDSNITARPISDSQIGTGATFERGEQVEVSGNTQSSLIQETRISLPENIGSISDVNGNLVSDIINNPNAIETSTKVNIVSVYGDEKVEYETEISTSLAEVVDVISESSYSEFVADTIDNRETTVTLSELDVEDYSLGIHIANIEASRTIEDVQSVEQTS